MSTDTPYPPVDLTQLAQELGVPVSQRMQPDFKAVVPSRFVTLAEAKVRGMAWCYDLSLGECRYGHHAARRTANVQICSDCERVKAGEAPIYGKSRANKHYPEPRRKSASAPAATTAPAAPAAPPEPSKKEQEFLAALDETRDFDQAAQRTNFSRSQIEARASVNEVFAKALNDLCDRRQIPRTRKVAAGFPWTVDIERDLVRRWIDGGLLHLARDETGVSASEYFAHLEASPSFGAMIEAARPLATEALKDRSLHAAGTGNVKLLEYLTKNAEADTPLSGMTVEQMNAEITRLLLRFQAQGLLPKEPTAFIYKKTGETIEAADLIPAEEFNADLVGGQ
jgi:hypothetical protein